MSCLSPIRLSHSGFHHLLRLCASLVEAGRHQEALTLLYLCHQRTSHFFSLPPHYQRRMMLDALGVLNLPHLPHFPPSVLLLTAAAPSATPAFPIHVPLIADLPADSEMSKRMHDRPDEFFRMVRLTLTEFLVIYYELEPYIRHPRRTLSSSINIQHMPTINKSHRILHPADELLLFFYASDNNTPPLLASIFNIDRTNIAYILDHVTQAIFLCYNKEISWPSKEEREASYGLFSAYHKAIGCIDGTHCRVDVPSNKELEDTMYSGYKHYHTQNFLLVCNALGFIIYVSGPYPGSWNDRSCFLSSVFCSDTCALLSEGELLLADGGFAGEGPLLYPYNKNDLAEAESVEDRKDMECWNEEIVINRSIVEHSNHLVKGRALALQQKWGNTRERQSELFYASARIINRTRRLRMEYSMYMLQQD